MRPQTPSRQHPANAPRRQAGIALLALLTVLTLWGLYLFVGQLSATQFERAREQDDAAVLAEAKAALIGRAATDANRPGSLPCPATDESGVSPLFAGDHCPTYIGRLPWKTLRVGDLRDRSGEPLWYALTRELRDDDSAEPINPRQELELTMDGTTNIAAAIFSPGPPLATQSGRPGSGVADYLDGANSDGDYRYVSGPQSSSFNDKVLVITRDDVFRPVIRRVLAEIRGPNDDPCGSSLYGLRRYDVAHDPFPWADSNDDGYGDNDRNDGKLAFSEVQIDPRSLPWLSNNDWLQLVTYQRLSDSSARIAIDDSTLDVTPCP